MCTPLACSDYYGGSVPSQGQQPTAELPATAPAARREGRPGRVPTFTRRPLDGGGAQLFPGSIATGTPQTFPVASGHARNKARLEVASRLDRRLACAASRPASTRLEPVIPLRGFHHWFTRRYTFPSCLPDPSRLVVPARPVVVRAAPAASWASSKRLPSASPSCCDRLGGGVLSPPHGHLAPRGAHSAGIGLGRVSSAGWPGGVPAVPVGAAGSRAGCCRRSRGMQTR
jgi:hypothetical protein